MRFPFHEGDMISISQNCQKAKYRPSARGLSIKTDLPKRSNFVSPDRKAKSDIVARFVRIARKQRLDYDDFLYVCQQARRKLGLRKPRQEHRLPQLLSESDMKKLTKVAIYARVSTADQNPESQLLALRKYAAQRGFTIYKEYVDHVTGSPSKRAARRNPADVAYRKLMEDVGKRVVDCVLVWKYDRFARSLGVLVAALQQFASLGVDFISYTQNIDTTTPMGRLFYHIIGSFAEFEREMIVERVRAGLNNARAKGKSWAGL